VIETPPKYSTNFPRSREWNRKNEAQQRGEKTNPKKRNKRPKIPEKKKGKSNNPTTRRHTNP